MIIIFDGPDGVGKTTQINLVADLLNKSGTKTSVVKMPSKAIYPVLTSKKVSPMDKVIALLGDWATFVLDADNSGDTLYLVDRCPLSSIPAYNAQFLSEQEMAETNTWIKIMSEVPCSPDLYLIFDKETPYSTKQYDTFEKSFDVKTINEVYKNMVECKLHYRKPVYSVYTVVMDKNIPDRATAESAEPAVLANGIFNFIKQRITQGV